MSKRDFTGANLSYSDLSKSDFREAIMRNVIFTGAKINRTDFSGADLSYSDLGNTDFRQAIIKNVNLSNANIEGTDFTGVDLSGVIWTDGVICGSNSIGQCVH